ncbi:MAG: hypothetical protein R3188_00640 [Acidiferrobacterales bacterium]|nr:hypothetical protein [Acidiferrobacterales bacterium]
MKHIASAFLLLFSLSLFSSPGYAEQDAVALARHGVDQVLNLEMDNARETFNQLGNTYPDFALTSFLKAFVDWADVEVSKGPERDKMRGKATQAMLAAANVASEKIIKLKGTNTGEKWYLTRGMANFFAARLYADSGHSFKAFQLIRTARDEMQELIKKHPDENDAYLVLGMYEYLAGSIPRGSRWIASLLGIKGDRALGVKYLEQASAKAPIMAPEAARMLLIAASVFPETTRSCAYLPMAKYVRLTYPNNPHYSMALQLLYANCGYPNKALDEMAVAEKRFLEDFPDIKKQLKVIKIYAYRDLGQVDKILAMKNEFPKDQDYWNLVLAQTYDVVGEHEKAKKIYDDIYGAEVRGRKIKTHSGPPEEWIIKRAAKYRKQPYKPADPNAKIVGNYLYLEGQPHGSAKNGGNGN